MIDSFFSNFTPFNISNADFYSIRKIKKYNGEFHALPYLSSFKEYIVGIYSFSLKHFGLLFPCFSHCKRSKIFLEALIYLIDFYFFFVYAFGATKLSR